MGEVLTMRQAQDRRLIEINGRPREGRTLAARCGLSFDDGQAHYHRDRSMGSLLETVADHLA